VQSIGFMKQLAPGSLWPTHFGRFDDVGRHLGELEQRLQDWVLFVEERMNGGIGRDEIAAELEAKGDAEMLAEGSQPEDSGRYSLAGDYPTLTDGLMRYISKRRKKTQAG
jgi:hypothetical protein